MAMCIALNQTIFAVAEKGKNDMADVELVLMLFLFTMAIVIPIVLAVMAILWAIHKWS